MRMKQTCVALLLAVALFISVAAQNDTSSGPDLQRVSNFASALDEYQRFLAMLVQLREPLSRAALAAYEALQAYAPEDQIRNAQLIVNILEGSQSPLYDPAIQPEDSPTTGIRAIYDAYLTAASERQGESDDADFAESSNSIMLEAFQYLRDWIRLASAAATAAETATDELERRDALLTAQAFIFALIENERALTQPLRVTVKPGESIQSSIDHAWPGATVSVEPGIYRETLNIRTDVTIVGLGFAVILEPVYAPTGIIVQSDDPIIVDLSGLTIRQADCGILVQGGSTVNLDSIRLEQCALGLEVDDNSSVIAEELRITENELAILAQGDAVLQMVDSWIEDCTGSDAAVIVKERAAVSMAGVILDHNLGTGLLIEESGSLAMDDSAIYYSQGDGILLTGESILQITNSDINLNAGFGIRALSEECRSDQLAQYESFQGSITGSGNLILAGDGRYLGNELGSVCPNVYEFLKLPSEEADSE